MKELGHLRTYLRSGFLVRIAVLSALFGAPGAIAQLTLDSANHDSLIQIQVRHGSGTAVFTVANSNKKAAVPLHLIAGAFTDGLSHDLLTPPTLEFLSEAGGQKLPAQVGAGQSLLIRVNVGNVSGTSSAGATLYNQPAKNAAATPAAKIDLLTLDLPLKITVDGVGSPETPLPLLHGQTGKLTLNNGGTEFLDLDYTLTVDGLEQKPGSGVNSEAQPKNHRLFLAPGGSAEIDIAAPDQAFRFSERLHSSAHTGQLLLRLHGPPSIDRALLSSVTLPVNLTLAWYSPAWTAAWSTAYVFIFLLLGGLLSVLVTSVLPNLMTKLELRRKMNDLADRTSSVSTKVDSYLRVLLRLQRKKIEMALQQTSVIWPTTTNTFDDIANDIATLTSRLSVAVRLDTLRRVFESIAETAPPSLTDQLDKTLQSAANQLHSFVLRDDSIATANKTLDQAVLLIKTADDVDALAKSIAGNFRELHARLRTFPREYYQDIREALPGVFKILQQPFHDPKNIVQPMFFAIDHGVTAMQTALDYAMVRASVPVSETRYCTGGDETLGERITDHECELMKLLGTLSWRALREAEMLVQQMRENVFEADAMREIAEGRARIVFDTQRARHYLPVFFSITFENERFLGAAAIERLNFSWKFPNKLYEHGVKVCHYFQGDEPPPDQALMDARARQEHLSEVQDRIERQQQIHAAARWFYQLFKLGAFADAAQMVLVTVKLSQQGAIDANPQEEGNEARAQQAEEGTEEDLKYRLARLIEVQGSKSSSDFSRLIVQGARFLVAFGVALGGLVSGALDQLAKLDFLAATVAIIALGFGANSIKNLLVTTTKTPETIPDDTIANAKH